MRHIWIIFRVLYHVFCWCVVLVLFLVRSWFVRVLFWWGIVSDFMHRRYAFYCAAAIMLQCSNAMPSSDSISIAVYSAIWLLSASFQASNDIFLLIFGRIA